LTVRSELAGELSMRVLMKPVRELMAHYCAKTSVYGVPRARIPKTKFPVADSRRLDAERVCLEDMDDAPVP
jgi:hypothetical protein